MSFNILFCRIGRTGRLGHPGTAITFFDKENDSKVAADIKKIMDDAGCEVPDWFKDVAGGGDGGTFQSEDTRPYHKVKFF